MDILILGLLLWSLPHLLKRIAPGLRGRLGDVPGKMLVTVLSLAAIALMVIGYRRAEVVPLYTPLPGIGHLNNLLMLIAIFLLGLGHSRGMLRAMRSLPTSCTSPATASRRMVSASSRVAIHSASPLPKPCRVTAA